MRKFERHEGIAAPLLRDNVNTDAIIPSVEMKHVSRRGLGAGLFAAWRYSDRERRVPHPDFVLNQPRYANASILLGGVNFGCGSSREHAVWALDEFGIRAIIAVSFGAIFRANCIANGLLPICLAAGQIRQLADYVAPDPQNNTLIIDLTQRTVDTANGFSARFEIEDSDADALLHGLDPVALTLRLEDRIRAFEERDRPERPWAYL